MSDASGRVVDSVKFQDTPPWPTGADGRSGSLERISPDESGESVANWASSPLSADRTKPSGTPDVNGTGKWTIYPWDEDQTWGLGRMMGRGEVFYNMPITFGMNGDVPPGQAPGSAPQRGFGFGFGGGGGGGWWRQPGWFSGPLLANPQFRKIFLARAKEILETIYTEQI